ncbi:methyltransferase domain-containing protein [Gordonia sp. OPL2]|nr:methyltransferase domain-containing protein [Gordonia sp. OPL2]
MSATPTRSCGTAAGPGDSDAVEAVSRLSPRLAAAVGALPLRPGHRVLEIGCGSGAAARAVAGLVGPDGHVLGVDRSERAVSRAIASSGELIRVGLLRFACTPVEDLVLPDDTPPFDVAVAIRVGAFDGRHPEVRDTALHRVRAALRPGGRFYIDSPSPGIALQEIVFDT